MPPDFSNADNLTDFANADLRKASAALQGIKANPEALKELDLALTSFRHRVGGDLNDATYVYVLNALINQRVSDGVDRFGDVAGVTRLSSGFRILAAVKV